MFSYTDYILLDCIAHEFYKKCCWQVNTLLAVDQGSFQVQYYTTVKQKNIDLVCLELLFSMVLTLSRKLIEHDRIGFDR